MVLIENIDEKYQTIRVDGVHHTLAPGEQRNIECDPSNIDFLRVVQNNENSEQGDKEIPSSSEENKEKTPEEVDDDMTVDEIKEVIDEQDLDVVKSQRKDDLIQDVNAALSTEEE